MKLNGINGRIFLMFLVVMLYAASIYSEDMLKGPWGDIKTRSTEEEKLDIFNDRLDRQVGVFILFVYQKLISPQLNTNCQFYPSCSEYAKLSVINYGFFKGYVMGIERFMRCNRWAKEYNYPVVKIGSNYKFLDTPESNLLNRN